MVYIVILALAVWVWALQSRLGELRRKVSMLEVRLRALAAEREPLLLDTVMIGPEPAAVANDRSAPSLAVLDALRARLPWIAAVAFAALFAGYLFELSAGRLATAAVVLASMSALALALGWGKNLAGATVALCITGAMQIWIWPLAAHAGAPSAALPFASSLAQVALASYATRRHWSQGSALAAHAAGVLLGVAGYFNSAPPSLAAFAALLVLAATLALGAFFARSHRRERGLTAFSGAWGAAALCAIAAFSQWASLYGPAGLALGAAALAGLAALEYGRSAARSPWPTAWWSGASAGLALLLAHALAPAAASAAVAGLLALAFIAFGAKHPALRAAACISALLALAHVAVSPPVGWAAGASAVIAAAALSLSARLARDHAATGETLNAATWGAILAILFAVVDSNGFDAFTRAGADAIALIAVGLVASPASVRHVTLRRWLGPVLVTAGFVVALGGCGLTLNPWWGEAPAQIRGFPILNTMAVALLLPAALAFLAAARWRGEAPRFARFCLGVSCAFALLWIVLELRRAIHGAQMATASASALEIVAYAAITVAVVVAIRTGAVRQRLLEFAARAAAQ